MNNLRMQPPDLQTVHPIMHEDDRFRAKLLKECEVIPGYKMIIFESLRKADGQIRLGGAVHLPSTHPFYKVRITRLVAKFSIPAAPDYAGPPAWAPNGWVWMFIGEAGEAEVLADLMQHVAEWLTAMAELHTQRKIRRCAYMNFVWYGSNVALLTFALACMLLVWSPTTCAVAWVGNLVWSAVGFRNQTESFWQRVGSVAGLFVSVVIVAFLIWRLYVNT
jgi:hypothetical protein